jgi:ketosteroid isomerase-like protein
LNCNFLCGISQRVTAGGQYESSKEERISAYFRRADFYPQTYNPKRRDLMKIKGVVFCLAFLLAGLIQAQDKADVQAIHKLIDEYCKTEDAGDMETQAKLMKADRIWIGPAGCGRITNQTMNIEKQQAQFNEMKEMVPKIKWFNDARDRIIKFYGDGKVAVASFYWYRKFILPAKTDEDTRKLFAVQPKPLVVTQVLVKDGNEWKIAHSHLSNLFSQSK